MALTKLMHMKQTSGRDPARHLKNGIEYILRPEKTSAGRWVGGNCGSTPWEVYQTMHATKMDYGKLYGRQGYHFVISFKEDAPPEKVYKVMEDFCKEYLGEDYDYVFAVHTDSTHIHAHVIFNSVSRTTGLKYHYKKGEWEKYIQPVTDKVCQKHGFDKFEYEGGESKDYGTWLREQEGKRNWPEIIRKDIDNLLPECTSIQELLEKLALKGYHIRKGTSRKHGEYYAFKPSNGKKAVRSYQLGTGYRAADLEKRVGKKPEVAVDKTAKIPYLKSAAFWSGNPEVTGKQAYLPSPYQFYYIRRYCKNTILYEYQNSRNYEDIRETDKLAENVRYLLGNGIRSEAQLNDRQEQLIQLRSDLDFQRKRLYQGTLPDAENDALREYQQLKEEQEAAEEMRAMEMDQDELWEDLDDRIAALEKRFPIAELMEIEEKRKKDLKEVRLERSYVQKELALIRRISEGRAGYRKEMKATWQNTIKMK